MARRTSQSRRRYSYQRRKLDTRSARPRFLIVCEGVKTEPNYFRKFPVPPDVVYVEGFGLDPRQLVDKAEQLRDEDGYGYNQVLCVFDRNSWPVDNFNGALSSARARGILVAWSNEAFELWYLLHFNYHDTAIPRADYITRLGELLGHAYAKNSRNIYRELADKMESAIVNAGRLLAQYDPPNPATDNPSTTVHLLVQELRRFSR